jgi:hypothetical protein
MRRHLRRIDRFWHQAESIMTGVWFCLTRPSPQDRATRLEA